MFECCFQCFACQTILISQVTIQALTISLAVRAHTFQLVVPSMALQAILAFSLLIFAPRDVSLFHVCPFPSHYPSSAGRTLFVFKTTIAERYFYHSRRAGTSEYNFLPFGIRHMRPNDPARQVPEPRKNQQEPATNMVNQTGIAIRMALL